MPDTKQLLRETRMLMALIRAQTGLDSVQAINEEQQAGINIVRRAIQYPIRQIVSNAGQEASIIVGKLSEQKIVQAIGFKEQN